MNLVTQIKNALEKLDGEGSTAQDVADRLAAGGHKGLQGKAQLCPVANYVKTIVTDPKLAVAVTPTRVTVYKFHPSEIITEVTTPYSVMEFITRFDNGAFPHLRKES